MIHAVIELLLLLTERENRGNEFTYKSKFSNNFSDKAMLTPNIQLETLKIPSGNY